MVLSGLITTSEHTGWAARRGTNIASHYGPASDAERHSSRTARKKAMSNTDKPTEPLRAATGSASFRIRLQCDYGSGPKWGEWNELSIPREKYGRLLDRLMNDPEVTAFDVAETPNS